MISIVLLEPENPGNIGAIARVMSNFSFKELLLVNPKCSYLCPEARNRAKHANNILEKARLISLKEALEYDYRIGTTGKLGTDYNLNRTPITPNELAEKIIPLNKKAKIALIFGRESSGLSNDEIRQMDFVVNIPTSKYPSLNISHAVAVILYELFYLQNKKQKEKKYTPISRKEINVLLELIDSVLDGQAYSTPQKKETQRIVWKHLLTKSMLTRREAFALMGFFRKML
jgi:tRNA/rRNA methyltransferase